MNHHGAAHGLHGNPLRNTSVEKGRRVFSEDGGELAAFVGEVKKFEARVPDGWPNEAGSNRRSDERGRRSSSTTPSTPRAAAWRARSPRTAYLMDAGPPRTCDVDRDQSRQQGPHILP
jgi:hypothetical protein